MSTVSIRIVMNNSLMMYTISTMELSCERGWIIEVEGAQSVNGVYFVKPKGIDKTGYPDCKYTFQLEEGDNG